MGSARHPPRRLPSESLAQTAYAADLGPTRRRASFRRAERARAHRRVLPAAYTLAAAHRRRHSSLNPPEGSSRWDSDHLPQWPGQVRGGSESSAVPCRSATPSREPPVSSSQLCVRRGGQWAQAYWPGSMRVPVLSNSCSARASVLRCDSCECRIQSVRTGVLRTCRAAFTRSTSVLCVPTAGFSAGAAPL
jgi:hypothetical protein